MARRSKARSLATAMRQSPVFSAAIENPGDTTAFAAAISTASGGTVGSGGSESVATASDLPLVGNEVGSFAFVEETNRLYIWNGNGWYSIALINTAPTLLTNGESSYNLSTDGTPTVIELSATDPEGVPIQWSYSVTQGSIINGGGATATITQQNNIFTITPTIIEEHKGSFTLTFIASDGINTAISTPSEFSLNFGSEPGGVLYSSTGTYTWVCPDGVTSVSVVAVGGGGGGVKSTSRMTGGGGGGLGWKNNIPVVPGQSYTVVVGAGGSAKTTTTVNSTAGSGGNSYFINTSTVSGGGGSGGIYAFTTGVRSRDGGTYTGDGGGNGGAGRWSWAYAGAGGGAGGYTGNGGHGSSSLSDNSWGHSAGHPGSGGGGGGGGGGYFNAVGGDGGGVAVYGQGSNGTGGLRSSTSGGSNGGDGGAGSFTGGATYGGGGRAADRDRDYDNSTTANAGQPGAVRIIWGDGRVFPSTNVTLASSTGGETTI